MRDEMYFRYFSSWIYHFTNKEIVEQRYEPACSKQLGYLARFC